MTLPVPEGVVYGRNFSSGKSAIIKRHLVDGPEPPIARAADCACSQVEIVARLWDDAANCAVRNLRSVKIKHCRS